MQVAAEQCDENFSFIVAVETYAQHVMHRPSPAVLPRPYAVDEVSDAEWARLLVRDWIGPQACKATLNLSAELTDALLTASNGDVEWALLEEAEHEACVFACVCAKRLTRAHAEQQKHGVPHRTHSPLLFIRNASQH